MKDFDGWSGEKKRMHASEENKLYREREMWWCSLGTNVGFRARWNWRRTSAPVLILRSMSRNTCYVVPLTTSLKRHKYRIDIGEVEGKRAVAIMSQMRLIDTKRLVNKLGFLNQNIFAVVRKAAKELL
jgi:mRNA-degrading endonuclease toxin of MazEF toxin-antitoxin module